MTSPEQLDLAASKSETGRAGSISELISTLHRRLAEARAAARIDSPRRPAVPAVHEPAAELDSREPVSNAKPEEPDIPLEPTPSAFFCPICVETTAQEPVVFRGKRMCRGCRDLLRE